MDDINSVVLDLMDLVTLAAGAPSGLLALELHHISTVDRHVGPGKVIAEPMRAESFSPRTHTASPDAPAVADHDFLFTCADRPFDELLAAWLPIRRAAPEASDVYFGLRYGRPTFTENRVLLLGVAAESLHRRLFGDVTELPAKEFETLRTQILGAIDNETHRDWVKRTLRNQPNLRERLRHLATVPAVAAVEQIIPDIESWTRRLVKARNGLAHQGTDADPDLIQLESATRSLLALVFMARLGLDDSVQERAATHPLRFP